MCCRGGICTANFGRFLLLAVSHPLYSPLRGVVLAGWGGKRGGLSHATVPFPSSHPGAPGLIWRVAMTLTPGAFEAAYLHHPLDPRLHLSRASSPLPDSYPGEGSAQGQPGG